jgi:hypothetical protein
MAVLADRITDPTLRPLRNARVVVKLLNAAGRPVTGRRSGAVIVSRYVATPTETGTWRVDLTPNAEITPAGTQWSVQYRLGQRDIGTPTVVVMRPGGPWTIRQLLDTSIPVPPELEGSRMGLGGGQGFWTRAKVDKPRALADLDFIAGLGMRWMLFNGDWPEIEPTPGAQDWSTWDWVITEAHKRGLKTIAAALGAPGWANGGGPRFCPPTVGNRPAFAAYAARMASHGADAILLWNEPNNPLFWRDTANLPACNAAAYAALVKAVYPVVHAANPAVPLIAGTTAPNGGLGGGITPIQFVTDCLAVTGMKDSFDAWSHHPYQFSPDSGPMADLKPWDGVSTPPTTWNALWQTRGIWNALRAAGKTSPLWLTEFGATTDSNPITPGSRQITETRSATYTADYYTAFDRLRAEGIPIDVMIQYSMSDNGVLSSQNEQDHFGQVRYDRTEKPQVAVLRAQAAKPIGQTGTPTPPGATYGTAVYGSSTYG